MVAVRSKEVMPDSGAHAENAPDATEASESKQMRENTENSAEFTPTYEFQRVPPGVAIPPGLYIRMNLETGVKEARLLHPSEVAQAKMETAVEDTSRDSGECDVDDPDGECIHDEVQDGMPLIAAPKPQSKEERQRKEELQKKLEKKEAIYWAKKYQEVFHPDDDAERIADSLKVLNC